MFWIFVKCFLFLKTGKIKENSNLRQSVQKIFSQFYASYLAKETRKTLLTFNRKIAPFRKVKLKQTGKSTGTYMLTTSPDWLWNKEWTVIWLFTDFKQKRRAPFLCKVCDRPFDDSCFDWHSQNVSLGLFVMDKWRRDLKPVVNCNLAWYY